MATDAIRQTRVTEVDICPGGVQMAIRALPRVVIGRCGACMAAYTIGDSTVIKYRAWPAIKCMTGGALAREVIRRGGI